jgi:hypothetical protein
MAAWTLVPCLVALRNEFDRIAPGRDRASDGSIGDAAHEKEVSDHNPDETGAVPIRDSDRVNEVHAIDVDDDLRESDLTMEKVVQFLLGRCRAGKEKRLRYIIYNRRIWSASSGWVQKRYTGASPHTEHAHFSASYTTSLEASTASWHLEDIPVALTAADKAWIDARIDAVAGEVITKLRQTADDLSDTERIRIAQTMLAQKMSGTSAPGNTYERGLNDLVPDLWQLAFFSRTKGGDPVPPAGVFGQILAELATVKAELAGLKAQS